ncbi:hypothetical protein KEM56_002607 [Ascosphaera pollenicola]|nr:hypothetical protein KEM56_002607 [Ascosphaera pollenicola]
MAYSTISEASTAAAPDYGTLRSIQHPYIRSTRSKPRRWPLVLRFIKGAVHIDILLPVVLHALFTAAVVYLDTYVIERGIGLPPTIIPSLSIVVGLLLVFRNQTSFNRFWDGRGCISSINTCIRNLTRTILTHSRNPDGSPLTYAESADVERTIRILIAIPYAVKHYIRGEWEAAWSTTETDGDLRDTEDPKGHPVTNPEYDALLPAGLQSHEGEGLGFPYQLTFFIDSFFQRGVQRGWFHAPGASQLQAQLNSLTDAFAKMETIKLTPIPVAHLIHQKQVLALFGCVLPFAVVDDLGWWSVPIVSLVTFTLYGIDGIGAQLEDPFGYDRNDIKLDAIVEDQRSEIETVLREWRKVTPSVNIAGKRVRALEGDEMFIRKRFWRKSRG